MKIEELNCMDDPEIIEIIRSDSEYSERALDFFLEKYKGLVLNQARSLFLIGADKEDLLQEGMIGLYKAVREYEPDKGAFRNFAKTVVRQQMCNAIKMSMTQKNIPLNEYISLYTPLTKEASYSDETVLMDTMEASGVSNPEDFIIDKENVSMIEYGLGKLLSPFEKSVYNLYVAGIDYRQIAVKLNRTPKSIDNALQRIRNKLTKWLEQNMKQ